MTIKELRQLTGLSQQAFAARYKIPVRSIENWESERNSRQPPEYLIELLEYRIRTEKGTG